MPTVYISSRKDFKRHLCSSSPATDIALSGFGVRRKDLHYIFHSRLQNLSLSGGWYFSRGFWSGEDVWILFWEQLFESTSLQSIYTGIFEVHWPTLKKIYRAKVVVSLREITLSYIRPNRLFNRLLCRALVNNAQLEKLTLVYDCGKEIDAYYD